MAPNLEFRFTYPHLPQIVVTAFTEAGLQRTFRALLDTGADITILDERIAFRLNLDLEDADEVVLGGVGLGTITGRVKTLDMILLGEPDLLVRVNAAFVPDIGIRTGNLLGRDVLEHVDLSLEHSKRTGYLGRAEALT